MSATPGWYPDPGGARDLFRYWDGQTWSASVSPTPDQRPPAPPRRRTGLGWMLALVTVLVVVVVVVVLVVQRGTTVSDPTGPGGESSTPVCPSSDNGDPEAQPGDGRVHAGNLSYPQLGTPWSAPEPESGVAFGRGVLIQSVETERSNTKQWLAAVLLGELVAGDGFFSPQDGAAIVVRCVIGTFYTDSAVTRDDQRDEALTVDGHDAWVIESELGFQVPGIAATSERLIVVVVDTGTGSAGLFYASIPANAPDLVQPARDALAALRVDS